jgi:hypothetical protein
MARTTPTPEDIQALSQALNTMPDDLIYGHLRVWKTMWNPPTPVYCAVGWFLHAKGIPDDAMSRTIVYGDECPLSIRNKHFRPRKTLSRYPVYEREGVSLMASLYHLPLKECRNLMKVNDLTYSTERKEAVQQFVKAMIHRVTHPA